MNASSLIEWRHLSRAIIFLLMLAATGCRSTSHAARNTNPVAASVPTGTSLDDIDARNRASIASQLGRPVAPGPATPAEVIAMTRAGIDPQFIICYINRSTSMTPITAQDVIDLHNQGVNEQVIQAMLTPGAANSRAEVARAMPPRIVILEDPWWPYYYPYYGVAYGCGCYHWR
jgi:hypothetical protein